MAAGPERLRRPWGRALGLALASLSFYSTLYLRVYWGPLAPQLEAEGIGKGLIGLVGSGFFIGYIASQIPGGMLADRSGPGRAMGLGLVASGASNIAIAFSMPSLWPLESVLAGFFAGMVYGPSIKLIRELFPEDTERAMGFYGVSWALPFLVAPWLAPYIAGAWGIQQVHIVSSVSAIAVGVADLAVLGGIRGGGGGLSLRDVSGLFMRHASKLTLISIGGILVLYYNWVIAYWLYYYLVYSGVGLAEASTAMTIYSIAGIVSMPLAGVVAERAGVFRLLIADLAVYGASGVAVAINPHTPQVFPLAGILGASRFITTPLNSTILAMSFEERILATASSTVNMLWQLSGLAAPYITAIALDALPPWEAMAVSALAPIFSIAPYALLFLLDMGAAGRSPRLN